jgi:L-alanine-DL-glutamate epimerase-like enolase superfamily enzyme
MKVIGLKAVSASRLHAREEQWITDRTRSIKADISVVYVYTDGGVTGVGEACSYGNPLQIADWVDWFAPTLIGTELDDLSAAPTTTGSGLVHALGSAHDFAVAGIDCALWDARGKAHGSPVSKLLNSAADDSVVVYASGGVRYDWRGRPESLIDDVVSYLQAGYSTVKVRLGTAWGWDGVTPARFLELIGDVRREIGDDVQLAVDGNSRLTRVQAAEVANGLLEYGATFLEEPLPKEDLEGYIQLKRETTLPISGGESFATREQFRPWLESEVLDFVQPDAGVCGLSELMRIGELAADFGVGLIPHSWHNGLMAVANAHGVAALPNATMVEECMVQGPLKWGVLKQGNLVKDGALRIGGGPGFGVDVIDNLAETYPYVEGHYAVNVYRQQSMGPAVRKAHKSVPVVDPETTNLRSRPSVGSRTR